MAGFHQFGVPVSSPIQCALAGAPRYRARAADLPRQPTVPTRHRAAAHRGNPRPGRGACRVTRAAVERVTARRAAHRRPARLWRRRGAQCLAVASRTRRSHARGEHADSARVACWRSPDGTVSCAWRNSAGSRRGGPHESRGRIAPARLPRMRIRHRLTLLGAAEARIHVCPPRMGVRAQLAASRHRALRRPPAGLPHPRNPSPNHARGVDCPRH